MKVSLWARSSAQTVPTLMKAHLLSLLIQVHPHITYFRIHMCFCNVPEEYVVFAYACSTEKPISRMLLPNEAYTSRRKGNKRGILSVTGRPKYCLDSGDSKLAS